MPDDVFKLPQSSYDVVCKIIMSYAHIGKKTGLAAVAQTLGTDPTVVSRNVGFLVNVGILEGGRDKEVTADGARLARALEFKETDDIAVAWRTVLNPAPLVQRILSAIRVRGGMDAATLQNQIVYTAGVKKTGGTMSGGSAVIEMLRAANLIVERDGKFIVPILSPELQEPDSDDDVDDSSADDGSIVQTLTEKRVRGDVNLNVEIQIRVAATVDDLDDLGERLRAVVDQLHRNSLASSQESAADES